MPKITITALTALHTYSDPELLNALHLGPADGAKAFYVSEAVWTRIKPSLDADVTAGTIEYTAITDDPTQDAPEAKETNLPVNDGEQATFVGGVPLSANFTAAQMERLLVPGNVKSALGAFSQLAGAGAIPITARTCKLSSGAAGAVMTLADGVAGQRLSLLLAALTTPGSHTAAVTPTHGGPWTLDTVGDSMELEFDGTNWIAIDDSRAAAGKFIPRIIIGVGNAGAGHMAAVGVKVGDKVLKVLNVTDHVAVVTDGVTNPSTEAVVTVNDQIQQFGATDLSAKTLIVYLRPLS